jgi:hypothetical protein
MTDDNNIQAVQTEQKKDDLWADNIHTRITKATFEMSENEKKNWYAEKLIKLAYHIGKRSEVCSQCENLKKNVEELCSYIENGKDKDYEYKREYLGKMSVVMKHLGTDHKMINPGQLTVVAVVIGIIAGVITGYLTHMNGLYILIGAVTGLFVGIINERIAKKKGRVF